MNKIGTNLFIGSKRPSSMDIVNAITKKKSWENKIKKEDVVGRWKKELVKQGAEKKVVDIVLTLLRDYYEKDKYEYGEFSDHEWFMRLGITAKDLSIVCKCKCCVCDNRYNPYYDEESDDNVPEETKKKRLTQIINKQMEHSLESHQRQIGKIKKVLVEGPSKRSEEYFCGRDGRNSMVVFPKGDFKKGDYIMVKIKECTSATLLGEVV